MHDLETLRQMGIRIPGITDKRPKRLTYACRERLIMKVKHAYRGPYQASKINDEDLNAMIDAILGGFRNSQIYYAQYGNNKPYRAYFAVFNVLLRELQNYRK